MSLTSYRAAPPRVTGGWGGDGVVEFLVLVLGRPGGDLLSHVLRRSTIGAEGFHGRVRDGIGCLPFAMTTRSSEGRGSMRFEITDVLRVPRPLDQASGAISTG